MERVVAFSGEYRWLSNFYPAKVRLDGEVYPTVEHAYQAAKAALDGPAAVAIRRTIQRASTPGEAKKIGNSLRLRKDWESVKLGVMLDLLRQKFEHAELRTLLLGTGDAELIEGNWWNDTFWGVVDGKGKNHLGRLLMKVRKELETVTGGDSCY